MILLSGCLVKSLHPYYTNKDVIYNKELIGTWTDKDSSVWLIEQGYQNSGFMKSEIPDSSYAITYTNSEGSAKFVAHLFQLDGHLYIDFFPSEISCGNDLAGFHLIAAHSLAKVELTGGNIIIHWYNEQWLINLFNENKIKIAHERLPYEPGQTDPESMQIILSAQTDELQKFIRKYGEDPEAFKKGTSEFDRDYTFVLSRK